VVVHADDGLDEISIGSPTQVAELKDGAVTCRRISPEQFGMRSGRVQDLSVADAAASLKIINAVLDDTPGPARDIVLLNAGAAIYVSGVADSLEDGVAAARQAVATGRARQKFQALIEMSNSFK
jgi:anthranilate phosphoribosyltransferase